MHSSQTVSFLSPDVPLDANEARQEGLFPPTLFSHAHYRNGVRLFSLPVSTLNNDSTVTNLISVHPPQRYAQVLTEKAAAQRKQSTNNKSNENLIPILSPEEAAMWNHKWAAKSASQHMFPVTTFRLLGTITRILVATDCAPDGPFANLEPSDQVPPLKKPTKRPAKMSHPSAKAEARREFEDSSASDSKNTNLQQRTDQIHKGWLEKCDMGFISRKGWDVHGELCREAINDDEYVPIHHLYNWILHEKVAEDSEPSSVASLYDGMRKIPTDLVTLLESLLDLSSPEGLYEIPLVLPHAIVTKVRQMTAVPGPSSRGRKNKVARTNPKKYTWWKVRVGVYANRLLPEVMTCRDLHIIMSSLDAGSYRTIQPLHLPPTPKEPAFASHPFPEVIFDKNVHKEHRSDSDDDEDGEEKKCEDLVDATIGDSTRDESSISAFTTKGFLKLLENTGNDISNWTEIEVKILPIIKLKLMLHQKHAICWMVQMESLGGFGINSILWEEREFLDGGKYYYSPALGQIRLVKPSTMRGGLLCDEQGLGKTVEVLGLIVATLDALKREAHNVRSSEVQDSEPEAIGSYSHATLVVVPPALVMQWLAEIEKTVGDELVIEYFDFKSCSFVPKGEKRGAADVVVTTYTALEKNKSARILTSLSWGRVVLDEMQEVRASTSKIARMCDSLDCGRRWMISGTPLFDGVSDLKGELNFLRLEPYSAKTEDGFFDFSIMNHWRQHNMHGLDTLRILSICMLRRSKSMTILSSGSPLLGLKPLTVEYRPTAQDPSERALYCFFESMVARELEHLDHTESRSGATRQLCLRLLREFCISPMLLNGGIGAPSQLSKLNQLIIRENRREMSTYIGPGAVASAASGDLKQSVMSCDEAIRYLSQAQEHAHVGEDFVTTQEMGMGGGLSSRSRAVDSVDLQRTEAQDVIYRSRKALETSRNKKAKALWHLALEKVTTGQGHIDALVRDRVSVDMACLWRWRWMTISLSNSGFFNRNKKLPELLTRGWRPSTWFCETELSRRHPEFTWSHPCSYQLQNIPSAVTVAEIQHAINVCLQEKRTLYPKGARAYDQQMNVTSYSSSSTCWTAVVRLDGPDDFALLGKRVSSANGIPLPSKQAVPEVVEAIRCAQDKFDEAAAQHKVYPNTTSERELSLARKSLERARSGLRIVGRGTEGNCHVLLSKALGATRTLKPASWSAFHDNVTRNISQFNDVIEQNASLLYENEEKLVRLDRIAKNQADDSVHAMSAFDALQALSLGEYEKTMCPICLGHLGNDLTKDQLGGTSLIAMTKCGHLFCLPCLMHYAETRASDYRPTACPNCRKPFKSQEVIHVDPSKADEERLSSRRKEAKRIVLEASRMLDESNGQLDAHMWEKLYLAIDLPLGSDTSRHNRLTAIPRDVLGHLRNATSMSLDCKINDRPTPGKLDLCLSSKIRALLADLPKGERSVVFSSSRASVKHLVQVLELKGVGCCSIFAGQDVNVTENAVNAWKSTVVGPEGSETIPYPVLVLQSGAAASGLTLTAGCKMFLLEPFVRQEEEQQAFARCHRYGQERAVHCRCYFTPVSVESRLLEWRKRAASGSEQPFAAGEMQVVYTGIRGVGVDEVEESGLESDQTVEEVGSVEDHDDEAGRTRFLLGLSGTS